MTFNGIGWNWSRHQNPFWQSLQILYFLIILQATPHMCTHFHTNIFILRCIHTSIFEQVPRQLGSHSFTYIWIFYINHILTYIYSLIRVHTCTCYKYIFNHIFTSIHTCIYTHRSIYMIKHILKFRSTLIVRAALAEPQIYQVPHLQRGKSHPHPKEGILGVTQNCTYETIKLCASKWLIVNRNSFLKLYIHIIVWKKRQNLTPNNPTQVEMP